MPPLLQVQSIAASSVTERNSCTPVRLSAPIFVTFGGMAVYRGMSISFARSRVSGGDHVTRKGDKSVEISD